MGRLTFFTETWRRWRGLSRMETFESWCNVNEPTPEGTLNFEEFFDVNRGFDKQTWAEKFADHVRNEIQSSPRNLSIQRKGVEFETFALDLTRSPSDRLTQESRSDLHLLAIGEVPSVEVSGARIRTVRIDCRAKMAVFTDCRIAILEIPQPWKATRRPKPETNLVLTNCLVGRVELGETTIKNFTVNGGSIRSMQCPPPKSGNPFTGSVTFDKNVEFPRSRSRSALFEGPQQYRSLRAHLEELENAPAVARMRALELAAERESDEGLTLFVNWVYGTFADYGLDPGRPLKVAGALYIIAAIIIFIGDGGAPGMLTELYKGWQTVLIEPGVWSEVRRSLLLPLQSLANPFGLFGARKLIVPATGWGQVLLAIQGLACDVLLAMSIIAIRKRFKLH